jgi:hypothetical protein
MAPAMSRYTERPMARAHEHLASARYAEAAGAFRAVLRIDPNEFQAHFGLADALVARGQRTEAVDGLVAAAESCTAREDNGAALTLYGKALSVDPMRLELHLDVAMAEAALGRMEAAQSRLEHLAEVYMQAGRTDEAAEVYRCIAGWEADGEEAEAEPEAAPVAPQRTTEVPASKPAQPLPRDAVPMTVGTSETVVISTILITPDGQLFQMPIEQQGQAWAPASGDTVPPVPAELLEVVHSAPLDLAAGEEPEDVERTVVGYPPPPPSLPENYESAAHPVNRAELEAAVVAAMNNLAQLEEDDMTLIMQRLPPQSKTASPRMRSSESRLPEFVTRSRIPKPELPLEADASLEADEDLEADADLEAGEDLEAAAAELYAEPEPAVEEPTPESKLRINRAPRPVAQPTPVSPVSPVAKGAAASQASAPSSTAKPAAAKPAAPVGAARAGGGGRASAPTSAAPARASASKPASMASKPAAAPARASAPAGAGKPASAPAGASRPVATPARVSAGKPTSAAGKPASVTSNPAAAPVRAGAPTGASKPAPGASKPAPGASKPAAAPVRTSASAGAGKPAAAPARAGAPSKPAPSDVPPPGGLRPSAGPAARPGPASGSARPPAAAAPKLTRPDNPLAERLRRRAGLQKPDAVPGRAEPRGTEPIIVRSPSSLPPKHKK